MQKKTLFLETRLCVEDVVETYFYNMLLSSYVLRVTLLLKKKTAIN